MRGSIVLAGVFALFLGQSAVAADKPIVVAEVTVKQAAQRVRPIAVSTAAMRATREAAIPEGSLEAFGSVGLPQ